jgi:hypothetical protein
MVETALRPHHCPAREGCTKLVSPPGRWHLAGAALAELGSSEKEIGGDF